MLFLSHKYEVYGNLASKWGADKYASFLLSIDFGKLHLWKIMDWVLFLGAIAH
jgi:hypothetical protein